jgi:putative restriction endonuclease
LYVTVIDRGDYIHFANRVPSNGSERLVERGLLNEQQRIAGRAQSAVRPISAADFNRILEPRLSDDEALLPRVDDAVGSVFREERAPFAFEHERERITSYTSRIFRDRVFRRVVLRAYGESPGFGSSTAAAALKPRPHISGL